MKAEKIIICIVGKTGTGKDTIAKFLFEEYGIESICSYTTRPKRDYETDGIEHYFIDKEKMQYLKDNEHIIAYTINDKTGIEYCATAESINDDKIVYIINPDGITYLKKNLPEGFALKIIYCDLDEKIIESRVIERGDNIEIFRKRLSSEREEFDTFRNSKQYDLLVDSSLSKEEVRNQVRNFMISIY